MAGRPPIDGDQPTLFKRGFQLLILQRVELVSQRTKDGGTVSAGAMKAVLRVIDDHARDHGRGCWVLFTRMAKEAGFSLRTVKRAVEALEALSFLTRTKEPRGRRGSRLNVYRLCWPNLSEAAGFDSIPADMNRKPAGKAGQDRVSAITTDVSAILTGSECHGDTAILTDQRNDEPPSPEDRTLNGPEADAAVGLLIKLGVRAAVQALSHAYGNRCDIAYVTAVVDHYEAHRASHGWTPAQLYSRLKWSSPAVLPHEGWPEGDQRVVTREASAARQDAQSSADEAEFEEIRARHQDLETRYGAAVDALSVDEAVRLVRRIAGGALAQRIRASFPGSITSPMIRAALLSAVQKETDTDGEKESNQKSDEENRQESAAETGWKERPASVARH